MKIALITDGIHPYTVGGMQRHSYYLAKYLADRGVDIDLYLPGSGTSADQEMTRLDAFPAEVRGRIHPVVVPFPGGFRFPGHYIRRSRSYARRAAEMIMARGLPDLIYAKGLCGWGVLEKKRAGTQLPPVIVNMHGYEMFQRSPSLKYSLQASAWLRPAARFQIRNADTVVSYGPAITRVLTGAGAEQKNIIEIPAGIESEWIRKAPLQVNRPLRFVFVGRPERRKGITELVAAIRLLPPGMPAEFHYIGDPGSFRKKAFMFRHHGKIVNNDELRNTLQEFDVLICPSYSEGMPNVILEAMAGGLAILASDAGSIPDMVSSENGWLLPEITPVAIRNAMMKIVSGSDSDLISRKESSIRMIREKFLWDRIAEETLEKLSRLVR